jgi:dihydroneopterin aldolase
VTEPEPPVVEIVGLRVFGRHGALPEEERLGQPFLFVVDRHENGQLHVTNSTTSPTNRRSA